MAPGRTAHKQRTRSSCIVNHGSVEIDGLIGQYGSEAFSTCAVHAIAAQRSSWHDASASRGRARLRARADPTLLPMPRPTRKAARISENVYTVAPKSRDSVRVHTTSAASAVNPESAIVMYTSPDPGARRTI